MPYATRNCATCHQPYRPRAPRAATSHLCWPCEVKEREAREAQPHLEAPPEPAFSAQRTCPVCQFRFVVPQNSPGRERCPSCDRLGRRELDLQFQDYQAGPDVPLAPTHRLAPPLRQAVFDLETWGLDRGWGVVLVGSILVFGAGEPEFHTFDLRDTTAWREGRRSNDSELGARILKVLETCHVWIAHNGARFDVPYLNSVALKYGMPRVFRKLIDPVQVARRKYRIGGNSLASLAEFLGLQESKMPVGRDVWRAAILDADDAAWQILRERCQSDVRLLAEVTARVTDDVGMIDNLGSFRG